MFFLLIEIVVLNIESIKKFLLRLCNHFEKKSFLKFHMKEVSYLILQSKTGFIW
jgi:hypothetical protein